MIFWFRFTGILLAAAVIYGSGPAQDRTAALRSRFVSEADPVHKAKLLSQLSDSEFHDMQALITAGNLSDASPIASQMADEAESAVKALDAKGRDPEKHPDGYKQLEFSVRGSLRRLNDILVGFAADDQQPFLAARNRLEDIEHHVIRELFPHRPDQAPAPAAPKS